MALCKHPMAQELEETLRGGGKFWWCPTCDEIWEDPKRPSRATAREDRVPNIHDERKPR